MMVIQLIQEPHQPAILINPNKSATAFTTINAVADLLGFINIAGWWGSWINKS